MKLCEIDNCGKKHYGKGLCRRHYNQLPKYKELQRKRAKKYYYSDKGQKYHKTYHKLPKRKESNKNNHLKQYGITIEEYNKMVEQQDNKCAICGRKPGKKSLSVDHDHITKKIRGLLCNTCNLILGYAKDNINILQKSISYLKMVNT